MKKAVILHGTDAAPDQNWFPWAKSQLEARGYEVWIPELPNNHTPNRQAYNELLFGSGWDLTDNLVIGHSSGAVSVLNLLADKRCPKVDMAVVIGAWHTGSEPYTPPEQFKDLFPEEGFDFATIKSKANDIVYLHGEDDPYCPLEQAKWLAQQTDSEIIVVPNGHHLGSRFKELPVLLELLEKYGRA